MPAGTKLHLVDLKSDSKEYKDVLSNFEKTMARANQSSASPVATNSSNYTAVIQIQRVQNLSVYAQYITKKKEMDKNQPGQQNEMQLFHGTTKDTCPKINHQGFNRSFSGKNGEKALAWLPTIPY